MIHTSLFYEHINLCCTGDVYDFLLVYIFVVQKAYNDTYLPVS